MRDWEVPEVIKRERERERANQRAKPESELERLER